LVFQGLPKALREALELLASEQTVTQLAALVQQQLDEMDPEDSHPVPPLNFDHPLDLEWSSGVEEFDKTSTGELWKAIGLPNETLPYFNTRQDPLGMHDPWETDDRPWFRNELNTEPFQPRWHQLVGILKMLQRAFVGLPILLMDEVGLGKTLQVTAVFAVLSYYRDFYSKNKCFPGAFGKRLPFAVSEVSLIIKITINNLLLQLMLSGKGQMGTSQMSPSCSSCLSTLCHR